MSSHEESEIYSEDLDSESEGIESENEQLHEISSKKSIKSSSFLPVNEESESSEPESKNEPTTTKKKRKCLSKHQNFPKKQKLNDSKSNKTIEKKSFLQNNLTDKEADDNTNILIRCSDLKQNQNSGLLRYTIRIPKQTSQLCITLKKRGVKDTRIHCHYDKPILLAQEKGQIIVEN